MVEILDESGRVFGLVNAVDLAVVLVILSVAIAGVLVLAGNDGDRQDPIQTSEAVLVDVTVSNVEPYVVEALPATGPIEGGNVLAIRNVSASPARVVTTDSAGEIHVRDHPRLETVRLTVEVSATRRDNAWRFEGDRLRVGREVTLDLNAVVLEGNVTGIPETT